jgi:membrane protein
MRAWWHTLRDSVRRFRDEDLIDRAAALTYYSVLAIFPGLIVLVALLGVLGSEETVDSVLRIANQLGADSAVDAIEEPITDVVESSTAAGVALVVGLAVALWSASAYVGAFTRAANSVYRVEEDRPAWKLRPRQLVITAVIVALLAVILTGIVLTGPLAEAIGDELGVADAALTAFAIAKWPLLVALVIAVISLLYRFTPNVRHRRLRWILPGAALATFLWVVASIAFSLYVSNFGSYADTYGSLAGVVVFLIWLWLSNCAVVLGAQFAAELERTAAAADRATPPNEFAPFVDHVSDPAGSG